MTEANETLLNRFNFLQKQFKVKSSFLSGYQLKQLREVQKLFKFQSFNPFRKLIILPLI